jgi:hypothetical protein
MRASKRTAIALLSTGALAGSALSAVSAVADHGSGGGGSGGRHGGQTLLEATLAPSVPGDASIHGVAPGAVPWVLRRGELRLRRDGRLRVRLTGLVIPGMGTPGPVTTVSASLYCGDDTTAAGSTAAAPISSAGDARIDGRLGLPAKCPGAVVLVHPNGNAGAYIASSGFGT